MVYGQQSFNVDNAISLGGTIERCKPPVVWTSYRDLRYYGSKHWDYAESVLVPGKENYEVVNATTTHTGYADAKYGYISFSEGIPTGCNNVIATYFYIKSIGCLGVLLNEEEYEFPDKTCNCSLPGGDRAVQDMHTNVKMVHILPDSNEGRSAFIPEDYGKSFYVEYWDTTLSPNDWTRFDIDTLSPDGKHRIFYIGGSYLPTVMGSPEPTPSDLPSDGIYVLVYIGPGSVLTNSREFSIDRDEILSTTMTGSISAGSITVGMVLTGATYGGTFTVTSIISPTQIVGVHSVYTGSVSDPDILLYSGIISSPGSPEIYSDGSGNSFTATLLVYGTYDYIFKTDPTEWNGPLDGAPDWSGGPYLGAPIWIRNSCDGCGSPLSCCDHEKYPGLIETTIQVNELKIYDYSYSGAYGTITNLDSHTGEITVHFDAPVMGSFLQSQTAEALISPFISTSEGYMGFYWIASKGFKDLFTQTIPTDLGAINPVVVRWGFNYWEGSSNTECLCEDGAMYVCDSTDANKKQYQIIGTPQKKIIDPKDWRNLFCPPEPWCYIPAIDFNIGDDLIFVGCPDRYLPGQYVRVTSNDMPDGAMFEVIKPSPGYDVNYVTKIEFSGFVYQSGGGASDYEKIPVGTILYQLNSGCRLVLVKTIEKVGSNYFAYGVLLPDDIYGNPSVLTNDNFVTPITISGTPIADPDKNFQIGSVLIDYSSLTPPTQFTDTPSLILTEIPVVNGISANITGIYDVTPFIAGTHYYRLLSANKPEDPGIDSGSILIDYSGLKFTGLTSISTAIMVSDTVKSGYPGYPLPSGAEFISTVDLPIPGAFDLSVLKNVCLTIDGVSKLIDLSDGITPPSSVKFSDIQNNLNTLGFAGCCSIVAVIEGTSTSPDATTLAVGDTLTGSISGKTLTVVHATSTRVTGIIIDPNTIATGEDFLILTGSPATNVGLTNVSHIGTYFRITSGNVGSSASIVFSSGCTNGAHAIFGLDPDTTYTYNGTDGFNGFKVSEDAIVWKACDSTPFGISTTGFQTGRSGNPEDYMSYYADWKNGILYLNAQMSGSVRVVSMLSNPIIELPTEGGTYKIVNRDDQCYETCSCCYITICDNSTPVSTNTETTSILGEGALLNVTPPSGPQ